MALYSTPKIPNPASAITSPSALYGGGAGGALSSTLKTSQPKKIINPYAAQTARNTTGYPNTSLGGGPTQTPFGTQTPDSIPKYPTGDPGWVDAIGASPTINPQTAIQNYLKGDAIRGSQIQALNQGLTSTWSNLLSQAQQQELAYGGVPRDAGGALMDLSQYMGNRPVGFIAGDETAPDLGQSLAQALSDPTVLANAQGNKFSALATIARQLQGSNAAAMARYGAYGNTGAVSQIMSEHQLQADQASQEAANTFLGNLNNLYSNWLGNFNTASGQYGQYNQDAFTRMMNLIQNSDYDPFGAKAAAAARDRAIRQQPSYDPNPDNTSDPYADNTVFRPGTSFDISQAGGFTGSTTMPAMVNPVTQPYYGVTTGPSAGERASKNKKGVYTIH